MSSYIYIRLLNWFYCVLYIIINRTFVLMWRSNCITKIINFWWNNLLFKNTSSETSSLFEKPLRHTNLYVNVHLWVAPRCLFVPFVRIFRSGCCLKLASDTWGWFVELFRVVRPEVVRFGARTSTGASGVAIEVVLWP